MSYLDLDDAKNHLNVYINDDDILILNKISAAEAWIALFLGADLSTFIPAATDAVPEPALPDPLFEALRQLVASMYANRKANLVGTNIVENTPGLFDLLAPYRTYVF